MPSDVLACCGIPKRQAFDLAVLDHHELPAIGAFCEAKPHPRLAVAFRPGTRPVAPREQAIAARALRSGGNPLEYNPPARMFVTFPVGTRLHDARRRARNHAMQRKIGSIVIRGFGALCEPGLERSEPIFMSPNDGQRPIATALETACF